MHDTSRRTALVLETNNLRGGDGSKLAASLLRAIGLLAAQTLPLTSLAQLIITHDGLDQASCDAIRMTAGRTVDFVHIDASTTYYQAKNIGFAATDPATCEYVAFADADCMPAPTWLAELLAPLSAPDAPDVVAGRTSYADNAAGTALTTIDFMYFPSPLGPGATRNFYANNVVFRRSVFDRYCYQAMDGIYRAHCQVLGLRLQAAGVAVHYAARAHTVHRLPDSGRESLKLRWMRGEDCCALTPYLVHAYLPRHLQWLGRSGPLGPMCVLLSRLWFSMRALNHQDLPPMRGARRFYATGLIIAFSAVDMAGAFTRGCGLRFSRNAAHALSYHRP